MSRSVLVTGGSGALGGAIVRRLRRDGDDVAFTFRTGREAAEALAAATGAHAFAADLTDAAQVRRMVGEVRGRLGRIDALVNNAGSAQALPFALIEERDWDEVLAANLKTMFLVTREVAREMVARKGGAIVNIGSLAGHRAFEVPVHWATAKAGVTGFTLALAQEFGRFHIRVNAVAPGLLDDGVGRMVPERAAADFVAHCAGGRRGTTAEVADVVAFLLGDDARYVNAQCLCVDGGI
ncbi:MAG: SDR family oxidoreductase [Acidobacteria bacterium]|nr:SDR family oxidoreductase [Acidobacteriota bacterium]